MAISYCIFWIGNESMIRNEFLLFLYFFVKQDKFDGELLWNAMDCEAMLTKNHFHCCYAHYNPTYCMYTNLFYSSSSISLPNAAHFAELFKFDAHCKSTSSSLRPLSTMRRSFDGDFS